MPTRSSSRFKIKDSLMDYGVALDLVAAIMMRLIPRDKLFMVILPLQSFLRLCFRR